LLPPVLSKVIRTVNFKACFERQARSIATAARLARRYSRQV